MRKEVLLSALIMTGVGVLPTKSVEHISVEDKCTAIVITTDLAQGGLTLPVLPSGDSIIFIHDRQVLPHERGHAEQICKMGIGVFTKEYISDPMKLERDADRRARFP